MAVVGLRPGQIQIQIEQPSPARLASAVPAGAAKSSPDVAATFERTVGSSPSAEGSNQRKLDAIMGGMRAAGLSGLEVVGFGEHAGVKGALESDLLTDAPHAKKHDSLLVVFGATGDLTSRMIVPSLLELEKKGLLSADSSVVGLGLEAKEEGQFRNDLRERVKKFNALANDDDKWSTLANRLYYEHLDPKSNDTFQKLKTRLDEIDAKTAGKKPRVFFLAIPPSAVPATLRSLKDSGLLEAQAGEPAPRVLMEKPFGTDLESAKKLNAYVAEVASDNQIFRIDHYLGKTGVLKLASFRFMQGQFERMWNNRYISHIEVKAHESIGIEGRGGFYDETGALRDMVQGHLLQALALTIMDAPKELNGDLLRDGKVAALKSLHTMSEAEVAKKAMRAQYRGGKIDGHEVPGYLTEKGVKEGSRTETFAALELESESPRWAGVPFHLSTGKGLEERRTEVKVHFKRLTPEVALAYGLDPKQPAVLTFHIEPTQTITLEQGKKSVQLQDPPGLEEFKSYERILLEAMEGDSSLFVRNDEVEAAWTAVDPVLKFWAKDKGALPTYQAGAKGPWSAFAKGFLHSESKKEIKAERHAV